ncbi:MAG: hypothetical protein CM15mV52_0890 [uncultured marine virus]|nr:MAG: hypothetical protein CM15mV52_0890 [uncultured marine virus]
MEVTQARTSKAADKAMMNMKNAEPDKETESLRNHVKGVTSKLNRMIVDFVNRMTPEQQQKFDQSLGTMGSSFGALRTTIDSTLRRGGY